MIAWVLAKIVRLLGRPLATGTARVEPRDAIVVLGARLRSDGTLADPLEERVRAGVALFHAGGAPVLCMTGGHDPSLAPSVSTEARAMAKRAVALGVPESALVIEERSASTRENARFSAEILLPARRRVWVVTNPFHLRRAVRHFRKAGFDARGWLVEDSLQHRYPALGLKWVLREYVSWLKLTLGRQ